MKALLLAVLVIGSFSVLAEDGRVDCSNPTNQRALNYCSAIEAQKSLQELKNKIVSVCKQEEDVIEGEGGTMYPLLLNSCISEKARELSKLVK
jgi:hypothetical protein